MQLSRIIPQLQSSLICEDVRREVNGKIMLLGVMNFLPVPQIPIGMRFCIFNQWTAGVGEFRECVRVLAPDQKTVLAKGELKFALEDPTRPASNLNVIGIKVEQAGLYHVEVMIDDVLKLRIPLPIVHIPPPNAPGAPTGGTATA